VKPEAPFLVFFLRDSLSGNKQPSSQLSQSEIEEEGGGGGGRKEEGGGGGGARGRGGGGDQI
jgi:hypothetical protein